MQSSDSIPRIAITQGDPCGIGPEVILSSLNLDAPHQAHFLIFGSRPLFAKRAEALGLKLHQIEETQSLEFIDMGMPYDGIPGEPSAQDAKFTVEAINAATNMVLEHTADALVTAPINKSVLYDVGFSHPGHTEYLGHLAHLHTGDDYHPIMMIAAGSFRTVPTTIHIPLSQIAQALTGPLLEKTIRIVHQALISQFGLQTPRIAIAGLNPHAGEAGALGREEIDIIIPVIEKLALEIDHLHGPLPADTMFHPDARAQYDAAICMYHDQALIPAKMHDFHNGVNVTLGLPFIRTSPDHGTAYNIAGKGVANASSMRAAIHMACEMVENTRCR